LVPLLSNLSTRKSYTFLYACWHAISIYGWGG